ncbi:MAG: hypothetical protein KDK36_15505, partial [Leptospiraceae bacterium]|nr:hypothetical protein [Leptospiraceae bacterium]
IIIIIIISNMNFLKLLPLFILFISCNHYFILRDSPETNITEELKNKKVTLIGFCSYRISSSERKVGKVKTTTTRAILDTSYCAKEFFEFGTPIEKQTFKGIRNDVPEKVKQDFILYFWNNTGMEGIRELNPILIEKNKKLFLRDSDSDYYVQGFVNPPMGTTPTLLGFTVGLTTIFPAIATLGTIPAFNQFQYTMKIRVFDKNFKLIKEYNYENKTFWKMASWWKGKPSKEYLDLSHPKEIFSPEIKDFTNEFTRDFK